MKKLLIAAMVAVLSFISFGSSAQDGYNYTDGDRNYKMVDFSATVKNMHLWRGLEVTSEFMTGTDLWFTDRSGQFKFGVWGGAGFTGKFREFDYYIQYSYKGFTIALWDIYNFSKDATYNINDIFNYRAHETGHFIDLSVAYRFQGKFPLQLSWATIIEGRDRGINNSQNLYSTYVSADYPIMSNRIVNLDIGLAGAFALNKESGSKANFYGKKGGIVNVNVTASKKLKLGNWIVPVSAMAMWNPVNNYANLQLAITLF